MDKKTQEIHEELINIINYDGNYCERYGIDGDSIYGIFTTRNFDDNSLIIYSQDGYQIDSIHPRYGEVIEAILKYIKDKDPIDEFLKSIAV